MTTTPRSGRVPPRSLKPKKARRSPAQAAAEGQRQSHDEDDDDDDNDVGG
jgi:hypothetical protein